MEKFQLSRFVKEGAELLIDVTKEFQQLNIDVSNLPKVFPDDSGKIKLVFVGQYSAGKSSIIKMLTGEDVAIGAKITTQTSTPYEWNGLEIIDTPGIHTELRPDHDEITYNEINHAALLIFVITNEGFSQRIGDHFRELAIKQQRADNMILVVNKMDRTALGNVTEQQEVIYNDLKKVTAPYDPKQLYLSFTDTTAYFDSLVEKDAEIKAELFELSGYDDFVKNLNNFVAAKGVLQKINLPLNIIAAEIRKTIGMNIDAATKSDIDAYISTVNYKKKIFLDGKRNCLDDVNGLITVLKTELNSCGRDTANKILEQTSEADAKKVMDAAQIKIKNIVAEYAEEVDVCTQEFIETVKVNIARYENTTFVQNVNTNLFSHFDLANSGIGKGGAAAIGAVGMGAGAVIAARGAQFAAQFIMPAITPLGEFFGEAVTIGLDIALAEDAGIFSSLIANQAGNLIRALPFFQAEVTLSSKIASFIAANARAIGAAVGVVAAAVSIYMIHRDGEKAKEMERERTQIYEEIVAEFQQLADNIGKMIYDNVHQWMEQAVDPVIAKFDDEVKSVESQVYGAQVKSEKLSQMLNRTEKLIGEIQGNTQ